MSRAAHILIALSSLLLLIACGRGGEMRRQLASLQARNQADSLLTDAALARSLCDWFDRHGTPNERMEAHYLLGRTHADLGEAPAALDSYQNAADCADTAAADCDYRQLCRVYAQMASVFYQQNLIDDFILCLDRSAQLAMKDGDSLAAIGSYGHKILGYQRRQDHDAIIALCDSVCRQYASMGYMQAAAQYRGYAMKSYLAKNDTASARRCMQLYESESGLFDSVGHIAEGREVYYFSKGLYYLAVQKYDSAEFCFRRELRDGLDFNNQNAGSRGLAMLYQQTQRPDSAAKYALYSYEMNDSVYARMATAEVEKTKGMYDYTRHLRLAQQERARANQEQRKSRTLVFIIAAAALSAVCAVVAWKRRRKAEHAEYLRLLAEMESLCSEIICLRAHGDELEDLIREKEEKLSQIKEKYRRYRKEEQRRRHDADMSLANSAIYGTVLKKADLGVPLTASEWHELNTLVLSLYPDFYQLISSKQSELSIKEHHACILLRIHVRPMALSNMLGCSPSSVTKTGKTLLKKLFNEDGITKNLVSKLESFY